MSQSEIEEILVNRNLMDEFDMAVDALLAMPIRNALNMQNIQNMQNIMKKKNIQVLLSNNTYSLYNNYECSICLEEDKQLKDKIVTNCGHHMCSKCVENINARHSPTEHNIKEFPCPFCRNCVELVETIHGDVLERWTNTATKTSYEFKNRIIDEYDIHIVIDQTGCSREIAETMLRQNNGDIVDTIISIHEIYIIPALTDFD